MGFVFNSTRFADPPPDPPPAVRPPAVAGTFYPGDPGTLRQMVRTLLDEAARHSPSAAGAWPKALIAPHAGYIYSGPIAASAYALLAPARGTVKRVVLVGPAHRVRVSGLATSSARAFVTPLGEVPLDTAAVAQLLRLPFVQAFDQAHAPEHCLEVHLPFLQETLGTFALVPLLFGDATPEASGKVAQALDLLWGGNETLIVISSDLSHYHTYGDAQRLDSQTCRAIEALRPEAIAEEQACGRIAIQGMLTAATRHALRARTIDLRNSGDTAGSRDQVVGYGAWAFEPAASPVAAAPSPVLGTAHRAALLKVAADSIAHGLAQSQALPVDPADYDAVLRVSRATFVTLHLEGKLRGCIGTLEACRPLVVDVAHNAYAAAFTDPRFAPVSVSEAPQLQVHISILSPAEAMVFTSRDDLLRQLRPGIDGLILEEPGPVDEFRGRGRRGTFLPAVWESLPIPDDFLKHLNLKAGLPGDYWSDTLRVWRYTAESVG